MSAASIGELRSLLTLETPVDVADDNGGETRGYLAVAQIWGSVQPVSGQRAFAGDREEQAISHRIAIRWRADVANPARLRLGDRLYLVRAAFDPDGKKSRLTCLCEEIS